MYSVLQPFLWFVAPEAGGRGCVCSSIVKLAQLASVSLVFWSLSAVLLHVKSVPVLPEALSLS